MAGNVGADEGQAPDLTIRDVTKRFGDFVAVDDFNLEVPHGEFFALLGPSGCGKTTTLRMVAGLETPSVGSIHIGGDDITHAKPYRRPVNTVFQSYALFPHMTIADNVAFGLKRQGKKKTSGEVERMLDLVELGDFAKRKPQQLSGGQQQRVALARALINNPRVLLLDEPLGALDLKLRRQMQIELKRIQSEVGTTFIHVTHDQEEAMTMADRVAVMNGGVIEQLGAPTELYDNPRTPFVANFLGQSNMFRASVSGPTRGGLGLEVEGQPMLCPAERSHVEAGDGEAWLGVRPEKVFISERSGEVHDEGINVLRGGVVSDVGFLGVSTQYLVRMPWGQEVTVYEQNTGQRARFATGANVDVAWHPDHTFALDASADPSAGVGAGAAS